MDFDTATLQDDRGIICNGLFSMTKHLLIHPQALIVIVGYQQRVVQQAIGLVRPAGQVIPFDGLGVQHQFATGHRIKDPEIGGAEQHMVTPLDAVTEATEPSDDGVVSEDVAKTIQTVQEDDAAFPLPKKMLERFIDVVQIVQGRETLHRPEKSETCGGRQASSHIGLGVR